MRNLTILKKSKTLMGMPEQHSSLKESECLKLHTIIQKLILHKLLLQLLKLKFHRNHHKLQKIRRWSLRKLRDSLVFCRCQFKFKTRLKIWYLKLKLSNHNMKSMLINNRSNQISHNKIKMKMKFLKPNRQPVQMNQKAMKNKSLQKCLM